VGAITNSDTIWAELEAIVLALLVLGRKMGELWVRLGSARCALRIFWNYLDGEAFVG